MLEHEVGSRPLFRALPVSSYVLPLPTDCLIGRLARLKKAPACVSFDE
jgi:hypothetical protein